MVYEQAIKAVSSLQDKGLKERILPLVAQHRQQFGLNAHLSVFSAPGRVEVIGNHTDHNHGLVLAAAVNLDTLALVSARQDKQVRLLSDGYPLIELNLAQLAPQAEEAGSSQALIRGVAAGLESRGYKTGGFDAVMSSQVLSGSGLSSSAAFEVLVCHILDVLYNQGKLDATTRAQIGQYAENAYFMKPSGLMDQMASSFGGLVQIDFGPEQPQVQRLDFSFQKAGYALVVLNTRSSHDDLTQAYAAIPQEMQAAARVAGGQLLRDVPFEGFLNALPQVRAQAGDRAALRGLHFYQENQRVQAAAQALENQDLPAFFAAIDQSGLSSETQLQNLHVSDRDQPLSLALALARQLLSGQGACRVHGGGFAGTTLNFVPLSQVEDFTKAMETVFGTGCCHSLDVRSQGPVQLI